MERVNPETGVIEESNLGVCWDPKYDNCGTMTRINPGTGVVEESYFGTCWDPASPRERHDNKQESISQSSSYPSRDAHCSDFDSSSNSYAHPVDESTVLKPVLIFMGYLTLIIVVATISLLTFILFVVPSLRFGKRTSEDKVRSGYEVRTKRFLQASVPGTAFLMGQFRSDEWGVVMVMVGFACLAYMYILTVNSWLKRKEVGKWHN